MEKGESVMLILVVLAIAAILIVVASPKEKNATHQSVIVEQTHQPGGGWPLAVAGVLVLILWIVYKLVNRRL